MAASITVRIIPLRIDQDHFPDCKTRRDVQDKYFLDRLPFDQQGAYYYQKKGLHAQSGTIVLFQCQSSIIASARFLEARPFPRGKSGGYKGQLLFRIDSIRVFEPVDEMTMQSCWPEFKRFDKTKQTLTYSGYLKFRRVLHGVRRPESDSAPDDTETNPNGADSDGPSRLDRRNRVRADINRRRGQTQFRNALRRRYSDQCVVTGCKILEFLEAAHLKTFVDRDDNNPRNGVLLRTDIHTLLDVDLLAINPETFCVELHPQLFGDPVYGRLAGRKLRCKVDRLPDATSLQDRYAFFTERRTDAL